MTVDVFQGGGIASIQSGFVSTTTLSSGSGEDAKYLDVTITGVDTTKCVVTFQGGSGTGAAPLPSAQHKSGSTTAYELTPRLTSSTNLRISCASVSASGFVGRWTVVEHK